MPNPQNIQLVSLDFDGTAAATNGVHTWLADDVVDVLNELSAHGVRWCSNSGRSWQNQLGIIQACRRLTNMPVAVLSGERFVHWLLPKFRDHEPFNSRMRARLEDLYPRLLEAIAPHRDRWRHTYEINYEQDMDLILGWNFADSMQATIFVGELRQILAPVRDVQIIVNSTWVIVNHREAGKGVILEEVCRGLGIDRAYVLAIGDHRNDLDMLDGRAAAHVACPDDANDEVKSVVREAGGVVGDRPHPEGVADLIRRIVLGRD